MATKRGGKGKKKPKKKAPKVPRALLAPLREIQKIAEVIAAYTEGAEVTYAYPEDGVVRSRVTIPIAGNDVTRAIQELSDAIEDLRGSDLAEDIYARAGVSYEDPRVITDSEGRSHPSTHQAITHWHRDQPDVALANLLTGVLPKFEGFHQALEAAKAADVARKERGFGFSVFRGFWKRREEDSRAAEAWLRRKVAEEAARLSGRKRISQEERESLDTMNDFLEGGSPSFDRKDLTFDIYWSARKKRPEP